MILESTPIQGLCLATSEARRDLRGSFRRVFCRQALAGSGQPFEVSQANVSLTLGRGTLRGMHFQNAPAAEAKLVRCLRGRVFDVAVDLRAGSSTFLHWFGVELAGGGSSALLIPRGFAHGFQCLEEECELLYFHDRPWSPGHEAGIRFDDPGIGIQWPLPAKNLSDRDRDHPILPPDFRGVEP